MFSISLGEYINTRINTLQFLPQSYGESDKNSIYWLCCNQSYYPLKTRYDICDKPNIPACLVSSCIFSSTGYLISLKDPELALAVEVCLKGQLQAFACDNHEDERALQGLMSKMCPGRRRPAIITSQFLPNVHDTRRRWELGLSQLSIIQSILR